MLRWVRARHNGKERIVSSQDPTISVTASREDAYNFLQALTDDDELRSRLETDPRGVLEEVGISLPEGLFPDHARLASKGQMKELLYRLGDKEDNKFGNPEGDAWLSHLLSFVFMWGALPFLERDAELDGAT
jgi:hypothetical protein